MEHMYQPSKYRLLLLMLICSLQCMVSTAIVPTESVCCDNVDNDGVDRLGLGLHSIEPNAGAIDLLPAAVDGNRNDWSASIRQSNTTCIRSALQSLRTVNSMNATAALNTTATTAPATVNSNEYLFYCDDASMSSVIDYVQTKSIWNGSTPGVQQQQQTEQQQATHNANATIAIVLNNIRLNGNRIRHRSQNDYNRNMHDRQIAIIDNATAYLSWINSDLDGDSFVQWLNQQRIVNKQHEFVHLSHLDVSCNRIANFTWSLGETMPNLRVLNVSHNVIDGELNLSSDWFQRLTQLQRLILSNNRLKSIAHLRLNNHPWTDYDGIDMITTAPVQQLDAVQMTAQLHELDLSHNQINDLQPNAFESHRLSNLRSLNLAHNQLSIIPFQVFQALGALEHLDLSGNRFVRILDNFFIRNGALKSLDLHNNSIEMISKNALYGLNQAVELDVSNNHIKSIDRNAFDSLEALQALNICENQLTVLPTTLFYRLGQLKRVNLSKNQFKALPNGSFANQYNLESIQIDDTAIQTFGNWISRRPHDVNKNILKHLRHVSIRNNRQLREIDAITVRNWPAVVHLNLSGNSLNNLPMEMGELSELTDLDISNNDLISVPKQLGTLPPLRSINLLGNSYACDCQMVWLAEWVATARRNAVANGTSMKAPLNQLRQLRCRQGYPGDFLRVLEQQQCQLPAAVHVTENKMYLLRSDAQLECSFSGNPIPDIIWVTPLNKIIRYYADPDAKPSNYSEHMIHANDDARGANADLEHQAKSRERMEFQIFKQKQIKFTAATEANGVTLLENGTLRVHNISRKDSGLYVCYGYNVMGTARSDIR